MSAFVDLYAALWNLAYGPDRYAKRKDSPGQMSLFGRDVKDEPRDDHGRWTADATEPATGESAEEPPPQSEDKVPSEPEPSEPKTVNKEPGSKKLLAAGIPADLHELARTVFAYGHWWVKDLRPAHTWIGDLAPGERSVSRFLKKRGFASPQEFYDKAVEALKRPKTEQPKTDKPAPVAPPPPPKPTVVIQPTETKGVFSVHRTDGEKPFALLHSPTSRGTRNWGIEYRSSGETPFRGQINAGHETKESAMKEFERILSMKPTDRQLGLAD